MSIIDLLSEKSPVLLVGDDDQALYETLKSASADHIRERHNEKNPDYASFSLPHCSRCTRVIVETVNDIITNAREKGFLKNRINKPYHYFEDEIKDKESEKYPKVVYCQKFAKQIPWFITKQVTKIAEEIKDRFSVLILSPTRRQARDIFIASKNKGFEHIEFVEKRDVRKPLLIDGLKILLNDKKSNLGWRIVSKFLMEEKDFESLLKETNIDGAKIISEIIGKKLKTEVAAMIKLLRAIKNDADVDENETVE